tara:strand:- start:1004 stop:2404 length:1401 start_codon:yes stop_codon:yes gene_type:complete
MDIQKLNNISPTKIVAKICGGVAAVFILYTVLFNTWFTTEEGFSYYVQNKITGNTAAFSEPGIHAKLPFFTTIHAYKRVATIDATPQGGNFTRDLQPISVNFADTYTGTVPATFRYRLPTDVDNFRKLHQEFRSFDNLVDSLLIQNSRNVAVVTATQYTGEEFIQGGVNAYKAQMEDQLRNGLYVTERRQVEIQDAGYAPVSSTNSNANKVENVTRLVWKNVVVIDPETGQPKRLDNPLAQYGITVSQVTIGKPIPDPMLDSLLGKKRTLVGEKIAAQQAIETNRTKAEAAKQEREIDKQRAIQDAQKTKELAVIAQQQEVEVEQQRALRELVQQNKQKDVAVVQKQKELEVAQANRDIQEANAIAATFEAQAILEKGLAEAQVQQAKLQAKQAASEIYMAEIQRDISRVMYPALKDVTITMPQFFMSGSDATSAPNSLEVFTTLGSKQLLDNLNNAATPKDVTAK